MIQVTTLNGRILFVNSDQILKIEVQPDTILIFLDQTALPIRETVQEIQNRIIEFKRRIRGPSAEIA